MSTKKRPARARSVGLALVLAMAMISLACSKSEGTAPNDTAGGGIGSADTTPDLVRTASGQPKAGGKLTMSLEAETDGWDPTKNRWAASGTQVALSVFDPLVALDKDLNPKPYLAESLTPNSDNTAWTIKLRPNIKFHNGQPLNADALVKSVNAFKASTLTGAAAKPIQNVERVDELSVKLTMEQPWATFPAGLTGQAGVVPAPEQLDNPNGAAEPIGTGPFVLKSWQRDAKFVATKNPDYWRKGLPYFDEVEFQPLPEAAARVASLQSGDTDFMVTSDEETSGRLLELAKEGAAQLVRSIGNNDLSLILINVSKPPLDDLRLRQAMAYALDREQLSQIANSDPSLIADSVLQPDSPYYKKQDGYPRLDPAKARELVDAYTKEKGAPPTFVLGSVTDPAVIRSAQAIDSQLRQVGFQTEIKTFQQADFIINAISGNYQAQVWRQFGGADPDLNYIWFISENTEGSLALNMARNKDPQIDAALKQGRSSLDPSIRKDAYGRLQDRLTADLPYLWLSHLRWTAAAALDLRGLQGQTLPDGSQSAGLVGGVIPITSMWREK
ncbi:MAG: hypothetical protein HYX32_15300 [Actinobacteria bacterium]|nr:hypothetical protein [Actinomycetota bacterium]